MAAWIVINIPTVVVAVMLVIVIPTLAVMVAALIRRFVPGLAHGTHNEVAGILLAVIGTIYAVVAGFLVVSLYSQFSVAGSTVEEEARSVYEVVHLTDIFPESVRADFNADARIYLDRVINDEWPAMQTRSRSPETEKALAALYTDLQQVEPATAAEEAFLATAIERLNDVADAHERRLVLALVDMPPVLWFAVLLSSAITIGFCFVFAIDSASIQYLMIGAVAMLVGLMLLQIIVLGFPFSGDVSVGPDALVRVRDQLT